MHDNIAARDDLEAVTGIVLAVPAPVIPGFAHDLGNLLQAASSAINIIEREASIQASHVRRAVEGAKVSIANAGELVRRALEGRLRDVERGFGTDVGKCLADLAAVASGSLDRPAAVEFIVEDELPRAACDELGLYNAILNLLLNARDAAGPDGRVSVRARGHIDGSAEQWIEINVADDGIGMTPATIARAFEPFFTTKCDGLGGIGLPMVERFVTATGGAIAIDSEPGTGTVVRMRLPAAGPIETRGEPC